MAICGFCGDEVTSVKRLGEYELCRRCHHEEACQQDEAVPVVVVVVGGQEVMATPEHLVLVARGEVRDWVPISLVVVGDSLVRAGVDGQVSQVLVEA